jgi:hypothetical protein
MKKIKDPIILGIVAGLTGTALKDIGDLISFKKGFSKRSYATIASNLFIIKKESASNLGEFIGWLTDMAMGAGLGVGLVYILKFTGQDHSLIKGIGYSHGAWTLLLGGANKLATSQIYPQDSKTILSQYLTHTLYGIGATLVATNLCDKELFLKEDIEFDTSTLNIDRSSDVLYDELS